MVSNRCQAGEENDRGENEESEIPDGLCISDDGGSAGDGGAGLIRQISENHVRALGGETQQRINRTVNGHQKRAILNNDPSEDELQKQTPDQGAGGNASSRSRQPADRPGEGGENNQPEKRLRPLRNGAMRDRRGLRCGGLCEKGYGKQKERERNESENS